MDQRENVWKLAEDKITAQSGAALDHVGEAAARLLADLYAADAPWTRRHVVAPAAGPNRPSVGRPR